MDHRTGRKELLGFFQQMDLWRGHREYSGKYMKFVKGSTTGITGYVLLFSGGLENGDPDRKNIYLVLSVLPSKKYMVTW